MRMWFLFGFCIYIANILKYFLGVCGILQKSACLLDRFNELQCVGSAGLLFIIFGAIWRWSDAGVIASGGMSIRESPDEMYMLKSGKFIGGST